MSFTKITDVQMNTHGVVGLPDTPNLSAYDMQRKFDELSREVLRPAHDSLIDELESKTASANLGIEVPAGMTADENIQSVIDNLAQVSHTHANKQVLDNLSEVGGELIFDGKPIATNWQKLDGKPFETIGTGLSVDPVTKELSATGGGGGGTTYAAGKGIDITNNVISTKTRIVDITQAEYDALSEAEKKDPAVYYNITDGKEEELKVDWNDISNKPDSVSGNKVIYDPTNNMSVNEKLTALEINKLTNASMGNLSGVSFNDITTPGTYWADKSCTDMPEANSYTMLVVHPTMDTQEAYVFGGNTSPTSRYYRTKINAVWQPWNEYVTVVNISEQLFEHSSISPNDSHEYITRRSKADIFFLVSNDANSKGIVFAMPSSSGAIFRYTNVGSNVAVASATDKVTISNNGSYTIYVTRIKEI